MNDKCIALKEIFFYTFKSQVSGPNAKSLHVSCLAISSFWISFPLKTFFSYTKCFCFKYSYTPLNMNPPQQVNYNINTANSLILSYRCRPCDMFTQGSIQQLEFVILRIDVNHRQSRDSCINLFQREIITLFILTNPFKFSLFLLRQLNVVCHCT